VGLDEAGCDVASAGVDNALARYGFQAPQPFDAFLVLERALLVRR